MGNYSSSDFDNTHDFLKGNTDPPGTPTTAQYHTRLAEAAQGEILSEGEGDGVLITT